MSSSQVDVSFKCGAGLDPAHCVCAWPTERSYWCYEDFNCSFSFPPLRVWNKIKMVIFSTCTWHYPTCRAEWCTMHSSTTLSQEAHTKILDPTESALQADNTTASFSTTNVPSTFIQCTENGSSEKAAAGKKEGKKAEKTSRPLLQVI